MRKLLTLVLAGTLTATFAACGESFADDPSAPTTTASGATATAQPALWRFSDADTTVYLFGTFHALPDGLDWTTPELEKAIAEADRLVLEIPDLDPQTVAPIFTRLALSPGLPPLSERVPAEKREALSAALAASGLPAASLDGFETWAAGLTLSAAVIDNLGLSAENGADSVLSNRFTEAGKTVDGLETAEQQLGIFDGLPEPAQRAFLESTIDDPGTAKRELAEIQDAWVRGDETAIAATFDRELKDNPLIEEALLTRRNANWAGQLVKRLDTPGTVLVAVGAGHLVGPGSVRELLERRGIPVTRVPAP